MAPVVNTRSLPVGTEDPRERLLLIMSSTADWVNRLDEDEQLEMADEIFQATRGQGPDAGNPAQVIAEWKATATIYADPELYQELTRPLADTDFGPAPVPAC